MKIALANHRYFLSGGPERYLFNVKKGFEQKGHKVIPFSISYSNNVDTKFSKYFVSPIGGADQVYFSQQKKDPRSVLKNLSRVFYSREVEGSISRFISYEKPDIAYVLHFLRKLSPSILVGIKKCNIPLVVRISDFLMLCPEAHFCRKGRACTRCIEKGLLCSVFHKCVKDSYIASLISFFAAQFHKYKRYFDLIDAFVFTNEFTMLKHIQAGFPREKSHCIPTFYDEEIFKFDPAVRDRKYITFVGRLDRSKGVDVLLEALQKIKGFLVEYSIGVNIVGAGDQNYKDSLERFSEINLPNVDMRFHGNLAEQEVALILRKSIVSVVPSIWFENLPNSLIESYACGTPVIASDIGSLSHYVVNGETGYLFSPGDSLDLSDKIQMLIEKMTKGFYFQHPANIFAQKNFSKEKHFNELYTLFNKLIGT